MKKFKDNIYKLQALYNMFYYAFKEWKSEVWNADLDKCIWCDNYNDSCTHKTYIEYIDTKYFRI